MGEASYKSDTLPSSEYSSERSVSSSSSPPDSEVGRKPKGLHRVASSDSEESILIYLYETRQDNIK